jgi:DNA polymerase-3 subunit gamma/tau
VGQTHVTEVLARSLAQGRVAHAYLLTGPRGVGKTSIARILAYEINKLPYDEASTHLDIIEIDAASNNGVEDVRDLREKVQIAPVSAEKKVYIIDEVHMLSKAAFNALLKTLEEPPEHAVFILATTDADKLPPTIISRTQRFTFRMINLQDITVHLKYIAKEEGIQIDDKALELIAIRGDGSFRDSISLLDQLRSLADEKSGITRQLVERALGLAPAEHVEKLLTAYEAKDLQMTVTLLDESSTSHVQPEVLVNQLIQTVRASIAKNPQLIELLDRLLDVPKSSQPSIKLLTVLATHPKHPPKSAALAASLPEVSASVEELVSSSLHPPVPSQGHSMDGDASPRRLARPDGDIPSNERGNEARQTQSVATATSSRSSTVITKHLQPETKATSGPEFSPGAKPFGEGGGRKGDQQQNKTIPITLNWDDLIEYTRKNSVAVYSVLSKCTHEIHGATLRLYTGNAFYKKKLDDPKHRSNLLKALSATGVTDPTLETIPTPPPPKDSQAAAVAAIMGGGEEVKVDA